MRARQVSGVFETRWVFVARSCSGGADRTELGPDSGHLFKSALIGVKAFLWNRSIPHERSLKNRPGIKSCLIGPPKAPAVFIFLLDWKVKQ
jgi:hypothetical protein